MSLLDPSFPIRDSLPGMYIIHCIFFYEIL